MAELRVRRREAPPRRLGMAMLPMGLLLAAGLATSLAFEAGRQAPVDMAERAQAAAGPGWEALRLAYFKTQWFEVENHAWILADHAVVTHFDPLEMRLMASEDGNELYANQVRGLPGLAREPRAFDRLYLKLAEGRYAPLRWRDVP